MKSTANRLESVKEYYFSRKLREVADLIKNGKPIINMGIGSPDLEPHPKVIEDIERSNSPSSGSHVSKLPRPP
jgi:aspartate/methionine/tyrosine aminotransferase